MLVRFSICSNIRLLQNAVGIWQVYRRRFSFLFRIELASPLKEVQNGETFLFSGGVVARVKRLVPNFITQLGAKIVTVCCRVVMRYTCDDCNADERERDKRNCKLYYLFTLFFLFIYIIIYRLPGYIFFLICFRLAVADNLREILVSG